MRLPWVPVLAALLVVAMAAGDALTGEHAAHAGIVDDARPAPPKGRRLQRGAALRITCE